MLALLRQHADPESPVVADRDANGGLGAIRGISLATVGPAQGHGFDLDGDAIDQIAAMSEGAPGRWTHGDDDTDELGSHLGRWRNVRRDGDRARADFEFSALAHKAQPPGLATTAADYLLTLAESEPEVAGASVVIDYYLERADDSDERAPVARVSRVHRADFVAHPAANRRGLLAARDTEEGHMPEPKPAETAETGALAQLSAQLSELSAKLAAETQRADEAEAQLAEARRAAEEQRAAEDAEYVASLQRRATEEAQQPIAPESLARVEALLSAGDRETAHALGDALLAASLASGGAGSKPVALGSDDDPQRASLQRQAEILRRAGWTVELSADGTHFSTKTPPRRK